jgi:hypothetical protein
LQLATAESHDFKTKIKSHIINADKQLAREMVFMEIKAHLIGENTLGKHTQS